ncbi:MAG: ATP-dependent helicase, partial [Alcaligenaceae bacterium]
EQRCGHRLASRLDSRTFHGFGKRLIDRYRPVLTGADALEPGYTVGPYRIEGTQITFREMVPLAIEILGRSKAARGALRQTYSHVFLDEFQDCTREQYELLVASFCGTSAQVTAVGDIKQRIMIWANALEGVQQQFKDDFGAKHLNLYQNRRSKPRLRRMQNAMVAVMDPDGVTPAEDLQGDEGEVQHHHFRDDHDEAEHVAAQIAGWVEAGIPHREIAVLVRSQVGLYALPLMKALADKGIAYRDEQTLQDLAAEPAAELVLNLLRVVVDTRQPLAYQRLMRISEGYLVDDETGSRVRSAAGRYISRWRKKVREPDFQGSHPTQFRTLVGGFIDLLGYERIATLSPDYQHGSRLDHVIEETLTAFETELEVDQDARAALRRLSDLDSIRVSTIHKSKGLEFENVIMLAIENQTFFGKNKAEERSTFFVGISRAKDRLILTSSDKRFRPAGATNWNVTRSRQQEYLSYAEE